jgi:hypothetical protein
MDHFHGCLLSHALHAFSHMAMLMLLELPAKLMMHTRGITTMQAMDLLLCCHSSMMNLGYIATVCSILNVSMDHFHGCLLSHALHAFSHMAMLMLLELPAKLMMHTRGITTLQAMDLFQGSFCGMKELFDSAVLGRVPDVALYTVDNSLRSHGFLRFSHVANLQELAVMELVMITIPWNETACKQTAGFQNRPKPCESP